MVLGCASPRHICYWKTLLIKVAVYADLVRPSLIAWEHPWLVSHKCYLKLIQGEGTAHILTLVPLTSGKPRETRQLQKKTDQVSRESYSENPKVPSGENMDVLHLLRSGLAVKGLPWTQIGIVFASIHTYAHVYARMCKGVRAFVYTCVCVLAHSIQVRRRQRSSLPMPW